MTTRERVLAAIEAHVREHGYAPTVRELQVMVGIASPSTIQGHLDRLERDGYVTRLGGGSARTIRLVRRERSWV